MGAVSALMHADRDPALSAIVLDSPFCSLRELATEIAGKKAFIPSFVTNGVMSMVRDTIQE